jgi:accessory colonization factor AcfC
MSTKKQTKPTEWEIKDRNYYLTGNESPLTYTIPSKHTKKHPLLWFDEAVGSQRELKYATNQASVFVDEHKGESTMGHITFRDGVLAVPKEKQNLQKMLSLYHPLSGHRFKELKPQENAVNELQWMEWEIQALLAARDMDIDQAEAVLRVEIGTSINKLSSKEIKRDLLMFAKSNPQLFMELANDENVQLRNFGIKATEARIIKLSQDQRVFTWASNGRKLMTVPFDENPYAAFAAFLKTDEGVEIYKSIEKKFK